MPHHDQRPKSSIKSIHPDIRKYELWRSFGKVADLIPAMASCAFEWQRVSFLGLQPRTPSRFKYQESAKVLTMTSSNANVRPCVGLAFESSRGGRRQLITRSFGSIPQDSDAVADFRGIQEQSPTSSLCKCCSRRRLLTSLGGAIVSAVSAEKIQAAETSRLGADAIREAVHPARPDWCDELYATIMHTTMQSYEVEIAGYKKQLFSRINNDVKIIMELGVGTGPNLVYYGGNPSITDVIGVDPNQKMARYAEAAALAAGLTSSQFKFLHAVGEGLPLPSASVDAVVCTLVLCSVCDVSSTLKEIQRVLRPGGMFLFVEHVAAPEGDPLRLWQNILDPVQQFVADGCHLRRDTLGSIEAAQFARVDAQRIVVKGASLIGPHVVGSAYVA